MENQNIEVNLSGETSQLVIRHGEAEKLKVDHGYNLGGSLEAPFEFYSKRKQLYDPEMMHLIAQIDGCSLALELLPYCKELKITITGQAKIDPLLEKLGINSSARYSPKELADLLKMHRSLFKEDIEPTWRKVVAELTKFKATVNQLLVNENDDRGNIKLSIEEKLDSEVPESFTLECPIFKYGDKRSFEVQIHAEVRDRSVSFWLYSVELEELIRDIGQAAIKAQLKKFKDEIVVIYK